MSDIETVIRALGSPADEARALLADLLADDVRAAGGLASGRGPTNPRATTICPGGGAPPGAPSQPPSPPPPMPPCSPAPQPPPPNTNPPAAPTPPTPFSTAPASSKDPRRSSRTSIPPAAARP